MDSSSDGRSARLSWSKDVGIRCWDERCWSRRFAFASISSASDVRVPILMKGDIKAQNRRASSRASGRVRQERPGFGYCLSLLLSEAWALFWHVPTPESAPPLSPACPGALTSDLALISERVEFPIKKED